MNMALAPATEPAREPVPGRRDLHRCHEGSQPPVTATGFTSLRERGCGFARLQIHFNCNVLPQKEE